MIKEWKVDRLGVRVFADREQMGATAGAAAAEAIRRAIHNNGTANVMFAAAPSQNETLAALCAAKGIDWERVSAFHMDEYIGLDQEHPAGFGQFLRRAVFDRVHPGSVFLLDGCAPDQKAEAERYGALLARFPLDVCLCGVGENGHLAFNDPPEADFHDRKLVRVVELEERCKLQQVHDGAFKTVEQVPRTAFTVTIPGLMSAKHIICTVPGDAKADAVTRMLLGDVSSLCPASALRAHPDAWLYLDVPAARGVC